MALNTVTRISWQGPASGYGPISRNLMMPSAATEIAKARGETRGWDQIYEIGGKRIPSKDRRRSIVLRGFGEGESAIPSWVYWAAGGLAAGGLVGYLYGRKK